MLSTDLSEMWSAGREASAPGLPTAYPEAHTARASQRTRLILPAQALSSWMALCLSVQTKRMPQRGKFSLGAACFGGITADDRAEAGAHAPETWLALFAKHASPAVLLGLFSSSRAFRDFVLATAPTATVTLDTTTTHTYDEWQARLEAVRQALAARDGRDTTIRLVCDDSTYSATITALIPSDLQAAGGCIRGLSIEGADVRERGRALAVVLDRAAVAFPQLTRLRLDGCACALPDAAKLPHLRELWLLESDRDLDPDPDEYIVESDNESDPIDAWRLVSSCAPYLPQLTTLTLQPSSLPEGGLKQMRAGSRSSPRPPTRPPFRPPPSPASPPHT